MSVIRTFTVTVVSTDSGNKYFIDGVQQATLNLGEGGTYKFDQSNSSNGNHPLRFSTTSNGTWAGGYEYTTGVTTNGVPGQAGAYTQIVVAASAPTLYYYCTNHSGMGGQANTVDGNSWGIFPWGVNEYSDQDSIDITLTGLSTTSSVGSVEAFNTAGWGRQRWGEAGYGTDATNASISLTGLQAQSELGTFDNAGTLVGWGRNGWGEEPYGDSFNSLVQPAGVSATSNFGSLTTLPEELIGITGVQATSALGGLTLVLTSVIIPTGVSATSNVGSISPTNMTVGLTGLGMTSTVGGIILDAIDLGLTGQQATSAVGSLSIETTQILTGVQATSAVGSLVSEIGVPLTGLQSTSAVGSLSFVFSQDITLTGVQATSEVGTGLALQYFNRKVPKDSTGYSRKVPKNTTGYTRKVAN